MLVFVQVKNHLLSSNPVFDPCASKKLQFFSSCIIVCVPLVAGKSFVSHARIAVLKRILSKKSRGPRRNATLYSFNPQMDKQ